MNNKSVRIINSTAEFLVFTMQSSKEHLEVRVEDETLWMTQKLMAKLFNTTIANINIHLKRIFESKELDKNSVIKDFLITASDGKAYKTKHYSLDAIISVGYRVNSYKATQFRQWATQVLRDYTIKGFVLDDKRMKNGAFLDKDYFEDLLAQIREIRNSERRFYQKITDIYATAMDYNFDDELTKQFFAAVQNKLHYAIHGQTAAELIIHRADSSKPNMGMTNWKHSPKGKILPSDVKVAKNYLTKKELNNLNRIVSMYLDFAEDQAERKIPMTMLDWKNKLNAFLRFNGREVLQHAGKVTTEIAKTFADNEFTQYRVIQDRLFESDFDREVQKYVKTEKKKIVE